MGDGDVLGMLSGVSGSNDDQTGKEPRKSWSALARNGSRGIFSPLEGLSCGPWKIRTQWESPSGRRYSSKVSTLSTWDDSTSNVLWGVAMKF